VVDFDGSAVEVRPEAVAAAFDAQACQMGDIVVEGPVAPAVAVPVDATTPAVVDVGSDDDRARGSPLTPIGWGLTIGGGVMGLAALATGLVAEAIYQDLRSTCGTTSCPVESEGDISLGSALATTSTVLTFAGLAILVTGIVLLIMAPSDESEDAPSEPVVRVIPGPGVGLGGEVRF
jgi:hypothetical protein